METGPTAILFVASHHLLFARVSALLNAIVDFLKAPKLVRLISGMITHMVSCKQRRFLAENFARSEIFLILQICYSNGFVE